MEMTSRFWHRVLTLVTLLVIPSVASAQTQPPAYVVPYQGYSLWMDTTEPGTQLSLYSREAKVDHTPPLVTCSVPPCQVYVAPGSYKIRVTETERTFGGVRRIDVRSNTRVTLDPDARSKRGTGLALGILGSIAVMVGGALVMSSVDLMGERRDDERDPARSNRAAVGGLMFLGGAIATPIGWVMFGSSFKPDAQIESD